jgi:hypothetical protein
VLCNLLCFWIVEFLGLAIPEWFFSSQSFCFVNKYLVSFIFSHLRYFVAQKHTIGNLEVIIYFQLVLERVHLCLDLFPKCDP